MDRKGQIQWKAKEEEQMEGEITKESLSGFKLSRLDVQKGEIEAVITSFSNYDKVYDRIMPGALDRFIKGFNGSLPMLFQHSKVDPVGEWTDIKIKGDLVVATGQIFPEVSKGADAMALISRGMIGSTSIGFKTTDYDMNDKGGVDFKEIELFETSLVLTPSNKKAQILSAKNEDGTLNLKNLERALSESGLSRTEAQLVLTGKARELRESLRRESVKNELIAKLKSDKR